MTTTPSRKKVGEPAPFDAAPDPRRRAVATRWTTTTGGATIWISGSYLRAARGAFGCGFGGRRRGAFVAASSSLAHACRKGGVSPGRISPDAGEDVERRVLERSSNARRTRRVFERRRAHGIGDAPRVAIAAVLRDSAPSTGGIRLQSSTSSIFEPRRSTSAVAESAGAGREHRPVGTTTGTIRRRECAVACQVASRTRRVEPKLPTRSPSAGFRVRPPGPAAAADSRRRTARLGTCTERESPSSGVRRDGSRGDAIGDRRARLNCGVALTTRGETSRDGVPRPRSRSWSGIEPVGRRRACGRGSERARRSANSERCGGANTRRSRRQTRVSGVARGGVSLKVYATSGSAADRRGRAQSGLGDARPSADAGARADAASSRRRHAAATGREENLRCVGRLSRSTPSLTIGDGGGERARRAEEA